MDEYEQQAKDFLEKHNLDLDVEYEDYEYFCKDRIQIGRMYQIHIRRKNNEQNIVFRYERSILNILLGWLLPTPYEIVFAISKDITCPHDFREFCRVHGYRRNKKIAERMFEISLKFAEELNGFFNESEKEDLLKIRKNLTRGLKQFKS